MLQFKAFFYWNFSKCFKRVYKKLRFCVRVFSEGHERSELAQAKSDASKQATNFGLA